MLKRYYSLGEAAEFIATATGAPFTSRDLFDLARRREISLCVYVSERKVTLCEVWGGQCRVGPEGFVLSYMHAYIELDPRLVDRNTVFPITIDQVFRVREDLDPQSIRVHTFDRRVLEGTPEAFENELGYPCVWTFCKHASIPAEVDSVRTGAYDDDIFEIQENAILIPAEDLLSFRRGSIEQIGRRPDTSDLAGKSKTSVLQLVGGLLMDAYRMDIHADRLNGIGDVLNDLARVGIKMDEKTLRRWIKEAAQVVEPPKAKP